MHKFYGVFIGILAAGGLLALLLLKNADDLPIREVSPADAISAMRDLPQDGQTVDPEELATPAKPPPGYIKYENKKYGFSYYHSPQAVITEYDEGKGAMTVVQENLQKVRGLQIFIVPYYEKTISEERFKADIPSGVRKNAEKTSIGKRGVEAVTFNSYDQFLGETREVWFIYNGYLYEVTTFRGVGDWFTPIMQTWRFLR